MRASSFAYTAMTGLELFPSCSNIHALSFGSSEKRAVYSPSELDHPIC